MVSGGISSSSLGGGGGGGGGCPLDLLPMEFGDLDEARRVADSATKASLRAKEKNRSRKKAKIETVTSGGGGTSSNASAANSVDGQEMKLESNASEISSGPPTTPANSELRTGRWTTEETAYCDGLIQKFITGRLPLSEGIKLNEFLSDMLKSKQSRLTKKMKNAKLSSKTFKHTSGYLADAAEAREFSEIEDAFFHSIQNGLERAEIKFHMQKEWREVFSTYCVSHGQPLNVDRWLASIEDMEKRVHHAKDAERMHRRKMMMGHALRQDLMNPDSGVVISNENRFLDAIHGFGGTNVGSGGSALMNQNSSSNISSSSQQMFGLSDAIASSSTTATSGNGHTPHSMSISHSSSSPYLHKIMAYVHSHNVPFEYVDVWVPSFVPDSSDDQQSQSESSGGAGGGIDCKQESAMVEKQSKCRLCFAGSIVANQEVVGDVMLGHFSRAIPLSPDDHFNLSAFGEYSESFSFDVGCGLPGRVYHMGVPTWEQSVHNAPLHHFERVGGAQQWGIRTVVGIPVPSPNVGRIVAVLYSRHDRSKDHDLVIRLTEEFTRLMPSPRWKLVVDVGQPQIMTQPVTQAELAGHALVEQQSIQQNQSITMDLGQNYYAAMEVSSLCGDDPAKLTSEVISIFGEHMPSLPTQPSFAFLQGFMSLRLLLLRSSRSEQEEDIVNTMLTSYSSYKAGGRTRQDIALMLARDFMFMNLQAQPQMQMGPQMQLPPHFSASTFPTSQMQQHHTQNNQQNQNNFIYSPSNLNMGNPPINNMNNNMPPPHPSSSLRQFDGNAIKLDNKTYNPENMNVMHNQEQKPQPLPPQTQQDSYTQGSNQQQQDFENCADSMLNELLSLPQDLMAAMTATATAAAAATNLL